MRVHSTVVLSTLLYGRETWAIKAVDFRRLAAFHHRCVRLLLDIPRATEWQEHISNTTLLERAKVQPIEEILKTRRLRWLGHVAQMDNSRMPKCILFGETGQDLATSWAPEAVAGQYCVRHEGSPDSGLVRPRPGLQRVEIRMQHHSSDRARHRRLLLHLWKALSPSPGLDSPRPILIVTLRDFGTCCHLRMGMLYCIVLFGVCAHARARVCVCVRACVLRETTNLENRILHDRGGCRRNYGGETGASPPT